MSHRTRKRSLEENRRALIADLLKVTERLGAEVTLNEFSLETGRSPSQVYRWFGNWGNARREAGLSERVDLRGRFARYSRDEILAAMQALVKTHGESLSQRTFCRETRISPGPIQRIFGGWGGLREAVGLDPETPSPVRPRYTREELADRLSHLVQLQGDVTLPLFCAALGISRQTVYQYGTWTDLRKQARLPKKASAGRPNWLNEMITEMVPLPEPFDG